MPLSVLLANARRAGMPLFAQAFHTLDTQIRQGARGGSRRARCVCAVAGDDWWWWWWCCCCGRCPLSVSGGVLQLGCCADLRCRVVLRMPPRRGSSCWRLPKLKGRGGGASFSWAYGTLSPTSDIEAFLGCQMWSAVACPWPTQCGVGSKIGEVRGLRVRGGLRRPEEA